MNMRRSRSLGGAGQQLRANAAVKAALEEHTIPVASAIAKSGKGVTTTLGSSSWRKQQQQEAAQFLADHALSLAPTPDDPEDRIVPDWHEGLGVREIIRHGLCLNVPAKTIDVEARIDQKEADMRALGGELIEDAMIDAALVG